MSADVSLVDGLQLNNYSAMAAITFTVYDIIITLDDDISRIWMTPWRNLKLLYLWLRYFPFIAQFIAMVITMSLTAGNLSVSRPLCLGLIGFQAVASEGVMLGTQIVLMLRVRAIYSRNVLLNRILLVIFVAEWIGVTVMVPIVLPHIGYGDFCVATEFPVLAIVYILGPLLVEALLFSLTMFKFYRSLNEGWGRERVISRFMADGIWAFFLPLIITTSNSVLLATVDNDYSTVAYSWQIAIPGFAGYRLILNLSHLLRAPPGSTEEEYTTPVLLTTVSPTQLFTHHATSHSHDDDMHDALEMDDLTPQLPRHPVPSG